jgi:hypothetical protein
LGKRGSQEKGNEEVTYDVLAYVNGIILIAQREYQMEEMLDILEGCCECARMELNSAKFLTLSSVWFQQNGGCRSSMERPFLYERKEMTKYEFQRYEKYLEILTGGNEHFKTVPTWKTLTEMREELVKISQPSFSFPSHSMRYTHLCYPK